MDFIINLLFIVIVMLAAALVGYLMDIFWLLFETFSNDDEVPDKPLRPAYIVKELYL